MEIDEILKKLTVLFREFLDDDLLELKASTTADDVEEWTSLNHLQIIVAVENHFQIKFNHRDVANLANIGSLCELIQSKIKE